MHDPEQVPEWRNGYLPLEDYCVLGEGQSLVVARADKSIDWWCVPILDAKPLFDLLLDAGEGGRLIVAPSNTFTVARRYLGDSNVLEMAFTTANGRGVLVETLNSGAVGRLPTAEHARRVDGIVGEVAFRVEVRSTRRGQPRIER